MGQEFYIVCIPCKEKVWVGKNAQLMETGIELHDFIHNYLSTLKLLDNIWHNRFVLFDGLEKFVNEHKDKRHHFLRVVGDEEEDYEKFRTFKEIK